VDRGAEGGGGPALSVETRQGCGLVGAGGCDQRGPGSGWSGWNAGLLALGSGRRQAQRLANEASMEELGAERPTPAKGDSRRFPDREIPWETEAIGDRRVRRNINFLCTRTASRALSSCRRREEPERKLSEKMSELLSGSRRCLSISGRRVWRSQELWIREIRG
jgi:hypothetical protein